MLCVHNWRFSDVVLELQSEGSPAGQVQANGTITITVSANFSIRKLEASLAKSARSLLLGVTPSRFCKNIAVSISTRVATSKRTLQSADH